LPTRVFNSLDQNSDVSSSLTHLSLPVVPNLREVKAVQIKPILARLQSALGRTDLIQQMVLLPQSAKAARKAEVRQTVKLVVGYNGSPNSQTALDMTLWIAHQTRMVTQKQVVVHVVYVLDSGAIAPYSQQIAAPSGYSLLPASSIFKSVSASSDAAKANDTREGKRSQPSISIANQADHPILSTSQQLLEVDYMASDSQPLTSLDHADYVLWQARCLAEEWRGSLEAHLRFGAVATELRAVLEAEAADLLLLGCNTTTHAIVQQLSIRPPCPILGIPSLLPAEESAPAACAP
jgi:nucleotide-binding universal stress UspA family protein